MSTSNERGKKRRGNEGRRKGRKKGGKEGEVEDVDNDAGEGQGPHAVNDV